MILTAADHEGFARLRASEQQQLFDVWQAAEPASEVGRRREVQALLEELCLILHGVRWVLGFEANVWAILHQGLPPDGGCAGRAGAGADDKLTAGVGAGAALARLRALSIDTGWWPLFSVTTRRGEALGRVVTAEQARAFYGDQDSARAVPSRDEASVLGDRQAACVVS